MYTLVCVSLRYDTEKTKNVHRDSLLRVASGQSALKGVEFVGVGELYEKITYPPFSKHSIRAILF